MNKSREQEYWKKQNREREEYIERCKASDACHSRSIAAEFRFALSRIKNAPRTEEALEMALGELDKIAIGEQ